MLHWDVNNGVARRSWARNPGAEWAVDRAMAAEPRLKVTRANHADSALIKKALS
jgi:urocanate hydratase